MTYTKLTATRIKAPQTLLSWPTQTGETYGKLHRQNPTMNEMKTRQHRACVIRAYHHSTSRFIFHLLHITNFEFQIIFLFLVLTYFHNS